MKKIILCSVLIFTLAVETSCGSRFQNTAGGEAVSGAAIDADTASGKAITGDKVQSANPYFVQSERTDYKGDFTFADDDRETKDAEVKCDFLGGSGSGKLYQLKLAPIEGAAINDKI